MLANNKPIPKRILITGASNHIGTPMTEFLRTEAPDIKLRLMSSSDTKAAALEKKYPDAEVVVANFMDVPSLKKAFKDVEGFYISGPPQLPPAETSNNLIEALESCSTLVHVVRAIAMQPELNQARWPENLKRFMPEYPDVVVKRILDKSKLPITYLSFGATFMDNLIYQMFRAIREERKMIWHSRKVPFIDPRDIGEVAARLLLSDNHRHIGVCHTLNNGNDFLRWSDVAEMMTELYGEKIEYLESKEDFIKEYSPVFGPEIAHFQWDFFEFEASIEDGWALNDFGERILGRKPTTMREWLIEHKSEVLGEPA